MSDKVLHKDEIFKQLRLHKDALRAFGVQEIGLFGSYSKNQATKESDIDFLVQFIKGKKNLHNLVYLADYLEKLFDKKVDLITPQGLSKHIGKYILEDTEYATL